MTRRLLIAFCAVAAGLSACNDSNMPTNPGRDLLNNPADAPSLGGSKYGQALLDPSTPSYPAIIDSLPGPVGPSDTMLPGYVHIADEHNRSKYKPGGYAHVWQTTSADYTKYIPDLWEHVSDGPVIDRTKYKPPFYKHIKFGPEQSKYTKNGTIPPATGIPSTGTIVDSLPGAVGPSDTPQPGFVHIADQYNRTKYKPGNYAHVWDTTSGDYTKYIPDLWEHINDGPTIDRTKYKPPFFTHIRFGPDQSKYKHVSQPDPGADPGSGTGTGSGTGSGSGSDPGSGTGTQP